jgi:hypothetical protein
MSSTYTLQKRTGDNRELDMHQSYYEKEIIKIIISFNTSAIITPPYRPSNAMSIVIAMDETFQILHSVNMAWLSRV